jgi:ADP-heptose:LPS heptosyltransferase
MTDHPPKPSALPFRRRWRQNLFALAKRQAQAFWYAATVILPIILRTRSRPVLFAKYSGIGDIICTFPAVLELKKRHPGAVCIYNCHQDFACLPRLAGVTNRVTSLPSIGLVGYWYRFLLAGFYLLTSDDDRSGVVPTEVYIKDFGHPFGLTLTDAHPQLHHVAAVTNQVKSLLGKNNIAAGPLILIHTGPSWPVREWPHEYWAALVTELRRHGFESIIQIGSSNHLALGTVAGDSIPGVFSLVDQLTLEESAALIAQGSLFIGIDSGLLHIAAAAGTPAVGIWGPTSPQFRFSKANRRSFVVSTAECQGCHHRNPRLHWISGCPFDIRCMKTISVAEVLSACLTRLKPNEPR